MSTPLKNSSSEKASLHLRNPHRQPYNFDQLCETLPSLSKFIFVNQYGLSTIDFANPEAVKVLNKSLLYFFYEIDYWDIPPNYLCPPIPGRADYIHYVADLLGSFNNGIIPVGPEIRILDIGVGANVIYPIIGIHEYGWFFTGADIDPMAIKNVEMLQEKNDLLRHSLEIRLQNKSENIFEGIIRKEDHFNLSICNPPFHSSPEEALLGSKRKIRNLGNKTPHKVMLNFGGQHNELWYPGGEVEFIKRMIEESQKFSHNCNWFSSLVAKSAHLPEIYWKLKNCNARNIKTMEMRQGQKISRIVAWTF